MKFKLFGTEIYVSFLFAATLSFMLAVDRTGLVIPTFFAVFIHETGHLLAMWASGCQPKSVRLIPASVQIVQRFNLREPQQIAITLCGPAANIVIFVALFINFVAFKNDISLRFGILYLITAVFNLLPVSGLDGGTLLTLLIAHRTDIFKAESVVRIITAVFAFIIFIAGVYLWVTGTVNISLFIVALYLGICSVIKR